MYIYIYIYIYISFYRYYKSIFLNDYIVYYNLNIFNYLFKKQSIIILKLNNETVLILTYKYIITDYYLL